MATRQQWIDGARPRTLPAAFSPVAIGTAISVYETFLDGSLKPGMSFNPLLPILALVVALALQIGVNYANDYSDGIRGTDEERVGPVRLVGQGLAEPDEVKRAAFIAFGIAAVAGLLLTVLSQYWVLLPAGVLSILAAWFYTGGKRPYGYSGFGELFVFVFFGLVAVIGTSASQTHHVTSLSIVGGVASGAFATALLVVNNLRDIPGDTLAGKKTLAVRLGDSRTRELYRICILVAYFMPVAMFLLPSGPRYAYVALFTLMYARRPLMQIQKDTHGPELITVLVDTGRAQLMFSMILTIAITASAWTPAVPS